MAYIKQRTKKDCGVAALAMLCDVDYKEANHAIPWRREGVLEGTTTTMLAAGAKRLGYNVRGTYTDRLKLVRRPVTEGSWFQIPDNSLVKLPHPTENHSWHWVAWRKNKIYDPSRGVFHPYGYLPLPTSYLEFLPC